MPAAVGLGIASLALSALGTGMSFGQASKQRKAEQKAIRAAEAAMEQARKRLEVNYLDALSIQKEPYELEREALLVAGAQGIEAARESERGAAAGVGRIQLAQQRGQQGIRSAMGREMTALDKAAAAEDSKIRDAQAQLDLGEAAGAQMAAANASKAAAAAQSQGFQQLASLGVQALEAAPLFSKSQGVRDFNKGQRQAVRKARQDSGKGFLGIGTGVDKTAVQNQFMLDTIKGNEGYQQMFSKLAGTQGLSDFNEKSFLANPQSYINRGSVEQQAYLQNLLYGTEMSYGDVDIDEEDEEDTGLMQNPRMATFGF
jgi:hypothetical protein